MTEAIPGLKRATAAKNPGLESFDKTHSAEATATKLRVLRHGPEMMPFPRGKSRHSLNPRPSCPDVVNLRPHLQILCGVFRSFRKEAQLNWMRQRATCRMRGGMA